MCTRTWRASSGVVLGRDHRLLGKNCQDAVAVAHRSGAALGVVADGCGSAAGSEAAAQLTARVAVASLGRAVEAGAPAEAAVASTVRAVVHHLGRLARATGSVDGWLFATLVGFVAKGADVLVFAVGDGVALIDDDTVSFAQGPAPAYPAYELLGRAVETRRVRRACASRVAVATDGFDARSLARVARLPAANLTRHLVLLQREGHFTDDGAVAVARLEEAP